MALSLKLTSISIPAISSGIFGFPKDRCAELMLTTALKWSAINSDKSLVSIRMCNFDSQTVKEFKN